MNIDYIDISTAAPICNYWPYLYIPGFIAILNSSFIRLFHLFVMKLLIHICLLKIIFHALFTSNFYR